MMARACVRIGASGHDGPGLEALGTAAGPWEGLESGEVAVGAADGPRPKINSSTCPLAPEGGDDGHSVRIGTSGYEAPGVEALGAAAGPWEGLDSQELAVGAIVAPHSKINPPSPTLAPEGGDDGQGTRMDPSALEGPRSDAVGAAAGPWEGLDSWEVAVGAAEAPRPKINPS